MKATRKIHERKRRHDDAHFPMQGRGKKATPPKAPRSVIISRCQDCGVFPAGSTHLCLSDDASFKIKDAKAKRK